MLLITLIHIGKQLKLIFLSIIFSRNGAPNHRANDVLVREGHAQTLNARFSYGPLDMAALTGERVDVHVMRDPPAGK